MSDQEAGAPGHAGKPRTLSSFFSSQAMLCLVTLMVFMGLLIAMAPVALSYLSKGEGAGGGMATRALGGAAAPVCNPVLATFADDVPMARLNAVLNRINATIAFGPNENGAFELAVASDSAAAAVEALNRMPDVVVIASLREQCLSVRQ